MPRRYFMGPALKILLPTIFFILSLQVLPAQEVGTAAWKSLVPLVKVEGGTFSMGSQAGLGDERPIHKVTLDSFFMASTEITQEQFVRVMRFNPSHFWRLPNAGKRPVEMVTWSDAILFCNQLSILQGFTPVYYFEKDLLTVCNDNPEASDRYAPGYSETPAGQYQRGIYRGLSPAEVFIVPRADGYRLPTVAEWEFAATGGVKNTKTISATNIDPDEMAWGRDNAGGTTHNVREKQPNELGLYDMLGNVREWCWDIYGSYKAKAAVNPSGAVSGDWYVQRGGSWVFPGTVVRTTSRHYGSYMNSMSDLGFRVVRSISEESRPEAADFFAAIRAGNPKKVQALLKAGARTAWRDTTGATALIAAAGTNQTPEIIQILLKAGAKIDARDYRGYTALLWAARKNQNPAIFTSLLELGAKLSDEGINDHYNVLDAAAASNPAVEVLNAILAAGVKNAAHQPELPPPAFLAARYNPVPAVLQALLGADVKQLKVADGDNKRTITLLMTAATYNPSPAIINLLLKAGLAVEDVDSYGRNALIYAAESNPATDVVKALLAVKPDINIKTRFGATALKQAVFSNPNPVIPELLLANGAVAEADTLVSASFHVTNVALLEKLFSAMKPINKDDLTRMFLLAAASNSSPDVLKWFIGKGVNVNGTYNNSYALIEAAIANPQPEVVSFLISQGAKLELKNEDGCTALLAACRAAGNPVVIKRLLDSGADVNARDNAGRTSLMLACGTESEVVVTELLKRGVDVNARDAQNRTPLMYASMRYSPYKDEGFIPLLLAAGARTDARDDLGNTALHYTSNLAQRKMLLKAGVNPALKNNEGLTYDDVNGWLSI